jgi:transcriptional regulator of arginine metabolism
VKDSDANYSKHEEAKKLQKRRENVWLYSCFCIILQPNLNKYTEMRVKNDRLEALRMIISSQELGSQDELLEALKKEGFRLTQATLSRDLKQLKVAKAATMRGNYVYVLPNETMYKRVSTPRSVHEMMQVPGFMSINFSGNMGVIRTRPGYASSIAYNIDNSHIDEILGTIAGDDTIFIVIRQGITKDDVIESLSKVVPNMR